jgi:myo-inositol-1(or 4)-monophosphatase
MNRTELAEELILKGGQRIIDSFGTVSSINAKKAHDYVTEVDLAIEQMYRSEINRYFPDDGILGEEQGSTTGTSGYRWIFDPLDGTNNFARGIAINGTMMAIEENGVIVSGYIYLPHLQELYFAHKGQGSIMRDLKSGKETSLQVSTRTLSDYLCMYSHSYDHARYQREKNLVERIHAHIPNFRGLFCAAYAYAFVASGKAELEFSLVNNPWDVTAGCLLVQEAGGKATDLNGNPVTDYTGPIAVTNGVDHEKVLEILRA